MSDQDRYIHLKEISVNFIKRRPTSVLELVFKDDAGVKHKSSKFKEGDLVHWNFDSYVRAHACATLTIQRALLKISVAQIEFEFKPNEFGDNRAVGLEDSNHRVTVNFKCGRSRSLADVTCVLGSQAHTEAHTDLASKVLRFLKLPQPAALLPPTSERAYGAQYPASIHWLNDDILLGMFDCYRLDENNGWNVRLGWCKLSHVCQRWRHLIYDCASHLGMHITCTNGAPVVDMLDHLPPLPLFVDYGPARRDVTLKVTLTEQDELGIYHALRLHDRVYHIDLKLPPSILHNVFVLLDKHFLKLEHLSLTFSAASKTDLPLTLPKAFLAPNLRHLTFPSSSPPRRLQMLTSTVSLVTLELNNIRTSSYFQPRLLVARLRSLPLLEELFIVFSDPIPRPSTEWELLGEQRAPVTFPSLKNLQFKGVGAYLESLVAQIRVPLLKQLLITLFNQIAFALPHVFHLINNTEVFKLRTAVVYFSYNEVSITTAHRWREGPFLFRVMCNRLDWQIDCATQICDALIPALSGVEKFRLVCFHTKIPTVWQNGGIDGTTWHGLLRSFTGAKELYIEDELSEVLSRALQLDDVGSNPGFLPNLRSINAAKNLFTSFIDSRQVVGRPVEFSQRRY